MKPTHALPATLLSLLPCAALAQTSYIAPDGRNRYPAVTIFCPNGTGVLPCNFGSGGGGGSGGAVTINQGGSAVSVSNPLQTIDTPLVNLINGGALSISGTVGLSGTPTVSLGAGSFTVGGVTQSGNWTVGLSAGTNAIGSVAVSNFPGTQTINGNVGLSAGTNAIGSVSVSNLPATQPVSGTVGLSAGTSAIGTVSVSNLPATQPVSGTVGLSAGSSTIGTVSVSNLPATQPVSGTVGLSAGTSAIGTVTVANLPATQPVSAVALPLPTGAATASAQTAPLGPAAPGAATATNAMVIGCVANTSLPSFTAGQQGAIPCDTSGRPFVVTVPSASNVPSYLQAVSSGGATVYRAINAASSAMAASVKSSSGMVYGYEACNSGTGAAYLRLFATGAAPNVGTTVPQLVKLLPAGGCQSFATDVGLVFSAGIGADVTTGSMADNDTSVIGTASQVTLEIYYK